MHSQEPAAVDNQEILALLRALRDGDFSQRRVGQRSGVNAEIAEAYNALANQLRTLSSEVARISFEMGSQGRFGGRMSLPAAEGQFKEMAVSVNGMATNLTEQFRDIACTVTARANGDMNWPCTAPCGGEMGMLKSTLNVMGSQFETFAAEVRRVGQHGGQAHVRGLAGVWKQMADDVNMMSTTLGSRSS